jgi:hypothetical protein
MTANGLEDVLTGSLKAALENEHHSFTNSDPGGFIIIAGVRGVPGGLVGSCVGPREFGNAVSSFVILPVSAGGPAVGSTRSEPVFKLTYANTRVDWLQGFGGKGIRSPTLIECRSPSQQVWRVSSGIELKPEKSAARCPLPAAC